MRKTKQRSILFEETAKELANKTENELIRDYEMLDVKIASDAEYMPVVTYLLRYRKEMLDSAIDWPGTIAKIVSACREANLYVKHMKNPKLGVVLTFPKQILETVFCKES